jgi:hypothetical protein
MMSPPPTPAKVRPQPGIIVTHSECGNDVFNFSNVLDDSRFEHIAFLAHSADRQAHALSSCRCRRRPLPRDISCVAQSHRSSEQPLHAISSDTAQLPSRDGVEKLKEYFQNAIKTWQTGRLTVFLDSLHQLDGTCGGRKLGWLTTHGLSPNLCLVVSMLPDAPADGQPFACLSILRKRYCGSPADSARAQLQPVDDVWSLLLHLLKLRHHTLSDAQLRVLEAAIKLSPRTQTPLLVILAARFSEWPTHSTTRTPTAFRLPPFGTLARVFVHARS